MQLTHKELAIHNKAIAIGRAHKTAECDSICVLREVFETKLYRKLGHKSLYLYALKEMGLSPPVAYAYHSVAKKSSSFHELNQAIAERRLTVHKATRILSSLTKENAAELVDYSCDHTMSEINFEVARLNPKIAPPDKVKVLSEDQVQITVTISRKSFEDLQRAESVLAQKQRPYSKSACVEAGIEALLEREDPLRKAHRAVARNTKRATATKPRANSFHALETLSNSVQTENHAPLTAEERHEALIAANGCCTHLDANGERCGSDRWIDVHHIIPRKNGGSNHPSNLTVLCSFHHDLVHQLCLPIEGQITWLRSRRVAYG